MDGVGVAGTEVPALRREVPAILRTNALALRTNAPALRAEVPALRTGTTSSPRRPAFKQGHRVMVQVQSTWFPLIDRNPQTFTKSIFDAEERDFVTATHRISRSARYPSRVEVPVVSSR